MKGPLRLIREWKEEHARLLAQAEESYSHAMSLSSDAARAERRLNMEFEQTDKMGAIIKDQKETIDRLRRRLEVHRAFVHASKEAIQYVTQEAMESE